jgi:hypothetical protein
MTSKLAVCGLALLASTVISPGVHAAAVELSAADQDLIRATAQDYALGWYAGDRERMGRSLHADLAKRAYLPGKDGGARTLFPLDKPTLLAGNTPDHAEKYAKAPKRAEVEILDGFGNAATVKLTMDGWVDYMHIARTPEGRWEILNVLWELTPPPAP